MKYEKPLRSLSITVAAVFGALASVLAMLKLSFPFPFLPYLKFDLAEIPVVFSFLTFGPLLGLLTSIVYWLVLTIVTTGEWLWPIGPFMKFLAVASMLIGLWLGSKMFMRSERYGLGLLILYMGMLAAIIRVIIMGIMNYVILVMVVPESLTFINYLLSKTLGLSLSSEFELILLVMILTSIFNIAHTALSFIPSAIIIRRVERLGAFIKIAGSSWMESLVRRRVHNP